MGEVNRHHEGPPVTAGSPSSFGSLTILQLLMERGRDLRIFSWHTRSVRADAP